MGEDNENINICRKIERRDKSVMGRSFGLSGQGRLLRGGESSGEIRMTRNQDQREFCMKGATCANALEWELCPRPGVGALPARQTKGAEGKWVWGGLWGN